MALRTQQIQSFTERKKKKERNIEGVSKRQAFHLAVKKFEENETAGGQGGREGPLAGSRDSVPVGVRGRRPLRKIGVSGHFEAKYGLF